MDKIRTLNKEVMGFQTLFHTLKKLNNFQIKIGHIYPIMSI